MLQVVGYFLMAAVSLSTGPLLSILLLPVLVPLGLLVRVTSANETKRSATVFQGFLTGLIAGIVLAALAYGIAAICHTDGHWMAPLGAVMAIVAFKRVKNAKIAVPVEVLVFLPLCWFLV